jgi:hypothetical protein
MKWCGGRVVEGNPPSLIVPHIDGDFEVHLDEYLVKVVETGRFKALKPLELEIDYTPRVTTWTTINSTGSGEAYGPYADPRYFGPEGKSD